MDAEYIETIADECLEEMLKSRQAPGIKGLLTGFKGLDNRLGGIDPGHYGLICARTGVGKTAFALALARNMMRAGKKVGFISLEMTRKQLFYRLAAAAQGIELNSLRHGWAAESTIREGVDKVRRMNLMLNTASVQDVDRIMHCVRNMAASVDIVFIDYMQLMRTKAATRVQELALASKAVFQVALTTKTPCVGLVQLNRDADGNVPRLANLKGTGDFEEDAVWAIALHRSMADENDPFASSEEKQADKDIVEAHILKNRWGELGMTKLHFNGNTMTYGEIDET